MYAFTLFTFKLCTNDADLCLVLINDALEPIFVIAPTININSGRFSKKTLIVSPLLIPIFIK